MVIEVHKFRMHGVLVGYSERNLFYTFYAICKLDTWGFLRNLLRCSSKRSYLSISYLLVCSSPLLFKPVKFVLLLRRSNLPCSTDIVLAGCISEDQTHENLMVRGADSGMSAATLSIYILLWPQKSAHWCVCVCVSPGVVVDDDTSDILLVRRNRRRQDILVF